MGAVGAFALMVFEDLIFTRLRLHLSNSNKLDKGFFLLCTHVHKPKVDVAFSQALTYTGAILLFSLIQ